MTVIYDGPERRTSERVPTDEPATIIYPNGYTKLQCRIKNRSDGGVLLQVDASANLPGEFTLITGDPEISTVCRIAWRIGSRTGCELIAEFTEVSPGQSHTLPVSSEQPEKMIHSRLLKHPLIVS